MVDEQVIEGRQQAVAEKTQGFQNNPFLLELVKVQKRKSLALKSEKRASNHFEMEPMPKIKARSHQKTLEELVVVSPSRGSPARRPSQQLKMAPIKPPRTKYLHSQRLIISEAAPEKPVRSKILQAQMKKDGRIDGQASGKF